MPRDFRFLLLPGFPPSAFVNAVEVLRIANRFQPDYYRWRILSLDGAAVQSCSGMSIAADQALGPVPLDCMVIVVAGYEPLACYSDALQAWLRQLAAARVALGAVDTGVFPLARAGVLNGYKVTVHWEALEAFRESFPGIPTSLESFEIDRDRISCAGGAATLDMMLHLISLQHGSQLAVRVSEQLVMGSVRLAQFPQRTHIVGRYGTSNKKLVNVIRLMNERMEHPLSTEALASMVSITARQLERLFRLHLSSTPKRFYLDLRLDKARQLLRQTELSITEVSLACGFESASYLARRYSARFACTPRQDRAFPTQVNTHLH
ncbi:GlxA family transcriptional regulator [Pseudomonas cremoricolorata]|uniref:GlxA family transcriptional regulator n=1 Tax=Pseudomonas cremoricolorata TaxID=157783 RepID=UPI000411A224|nr:GlxA family transcriptional regulator [Pseudomonas cremoricolorata]